MSELSQTTLPTSITINQVNGELQIVQKVMLWIPMIGLSAGIFFMGKQFIVMMMNPDPSPLPYLPYVFLVAVLLSIYQLLMLVFNKSYITINTNMLTVMKKPLPWFGNKRIQMADVQKFDVRENVRVRKGNRDDEFAGKMTKSSKTTRYDLVLCMCSGKEIKLLDFQAKEHADYIAQEIESYFEEK